MDFKIQVQYMSRVVLVSLEQISLRERVNLHYFDETIADFECMN